MISKKISLLVCTMFAAILFTSCSKEYTCTCTVGVSGRDHVIYENLGQVSKNDAQQQCNDLELRQSDSSNSVSADCHL